MADGDPGSGGPQEAEEGEAGPAETGGPAQSDGAASTDEEAVAAAREEVVEGMARAFEVWGIKRSYGRLYGILYFADEPLSLDELVERSGYAKSTVSTATSTLERYHLVQRRSPAGEGKKVFYEAERDFWHVFQQFLTQEVRSEIRIMTRALDSAAETLEDVDSERARRDRERVERLRSLYEHSETLVDVLTRASLERVVAAFRRLRSGGE